MEKRQPKLPDCSRKLELGRYLSTKSGKRPFIFYGQGKPVVSGKEWGTIQKIFKLKKRGLPKNKKR